MVRLNTGLEAAESLWADLTQAFETSKT